MTTTGRKVGIDEMVLTTPSLRIRGDELAKVLAEEDVVRITAKKPVDTASARQDLYNARFERRKDWIRTDIGNVEIRLPGHSEGNVTYMGDGLYTLFTSLMSDGASRERLFSNPITGIYSGSESGTDKSKPDIVTALGMVSSRLINEDEREYGPLLDMLTNVKRIPAENKFACIGPFIAFQDAIIWVSYWTSKGRSVSALCDFADTAIYDEAQAPNAQATQGGAGYTAWITADPSLMVIYDEFGSHYMSFNDFTKYGGRETPVVHGKPSEKGGYVYNVGKAVINFEKGILQIPEFKNGGFRVFHIPFPIEPEVLVSFEFAHQLKRSNPMLFEEIQTRPSIGRYPLKDFSHVTQLIGAKFRGFNNDGLPIRSEHEIMGHLNSDTDINALWGWHEKLRTTPEFRAYVKKVRLNAALEIPRHIGNSYGVSVFAGITSLLTHGYDPEVDMGIQGVVGAYGSGAGASVLGAEIVATAEAIRKKIHIVMHVDNRYLLTAGQYLQLRPALLLGEGQRMETEEDLTIRDMELLRADRLAAGHHVIRRKRDAHGDYTISDGTSLSPLTWRFHDSASAEV